MYISVYTKQPWQDFFVVIVPFCSDILDSPTQNEIQLLQNCAPHNSQYILYNLLLVTCSDLIEFNGRLSTNS